MPLCSLFVLSLVALPSYPLTLFFCLCIAVVQKGETDGSFRKENHTLQEQVVHFKKELQQAHDE